MLNALWKYTFDIFTPPNFDSQFIPLGVAMNQGR